MSDDEDYVIFGSKFTNPSTQGKIKHVQDEIVTDEQGRRRFHGAFTGGFSAGYYNSVGSKEGEFFEYTLLLSVAMHTKVLNQDALNIGCPNQDETLDM